ncbi:uncharacterized protein LOC127258987 [Andrographis paniculata]|uniref:uncharacterized protein LOC127258987 n=1 Tax=Andrographis paniculata TaxID=175694 RepID=UPI0021E87939|nr:uncharacterized protein LOC127258987 [Andrographis paniculata]
MVSSELALHSWQPLRSLHLCTHDPFRLRLQINCLCGTFLSSKVPYFETNYPIAEEKKKKNNEKDNWNTHERLRNFKNWNWKQVLGLIVTREMGVREGCGLELNTKMPIDSDGGELRMRCEEETKRTN